MIVVVCVLMVVMIICLTLIVGAYQTMSSVNDGLRDVSDYQQAKSFSDVLRKRIVCTSAEVPSDGSSVVNYILKFAGDMTEFDGNPQAAEEGLTKELFANVGSEGYDNLRIILNKKKVSTTKCTLFISVMTETSDEKVMSMVKAGYDVDVFEETDPGDGSIKKKMNVVFRAYY